MSKRRINDSRIFDIGMLAVIAFLGLTLQGCESNRHMVLASTGTNIGVEISQNPATQSPQAKLGYQRIELAIVPTNRSSQDTATDSNSIGGGAKDLPDVIMELRYGGIFDSGPSSGIYQRLAVGKQAVSQPGASLMFMKDPQGKIPAGAEKALKALKNIPEAAPVEELNYLTCLQNVGNNDPGKLAIIDAAVQKVTTDKGHPKGIEFETFIDEPTSEQVKKLKEELSNQISQCQ